jgi:hypothetical protein
MIIKTCLRAVAKGYGHRRPAGRSAFILYQPKAGLKSLIANFKSQIFFHGNIDQTIEDAGYCKRQS